MLFQSYIFIFLFLPIVLIGYYGLNHYGKGRLAKIFLMLSSFAFYAYADYCHYHTDINRYMAECFVSGECEVTQENKKDKIKSLEKIAKEYDYNLIFEK